VGVAERVGVLVGENVGVLVGLVVGVGVRFDSLNRITSPAAGVGSCMDGAYARSVGKSKLVVTPVT